MADLFTNGTGGATKVHPNQGVMSQLSWLEHGVCDHGDMGTNPDHGYNI